MKTTVLLSEWSEGNAGSSRAYLLVVFELDVEPTGLDHPSVLGPRLIQRAAGV